jgi:hypothetical protein
MPTARLLKKECPVFKRIGPKDGLAALQGERFLDENGYRASTRLLGSAGKRRLRGPQSIR